MLLNLRWLAYRQWNVPKSVTVAYQWRNALKSVMECSQIGDGGVSHTFIGNDGLSGMVGFSVSGLSAMVGLSASNGWSLV
nr:hypothetical protein CFP56_37834 [Quercus suber]